MNEIQRVIGRCRTCGQADEFAISGEELDEAGEPRGWVQTVKLPHTREDCARMERLAREAWPTLW